MNPKSLGSSNIAKADTISMATKKAPPRGKDLLRRLVLAEAENQGPLGQALVANSLFNRVALVTGSKGIGSPDRIGGDRYFGKAISPLTFRKSGKYSKAPNRESLDSFILASGQYEPIDDGRIWSIGRGKKNELTATQIANADAAIELAKNRGGLKEALLDEGVDSANVGKFLEATGFRTTEAFNDPSQNINNIQYGSHEFNSAGYPSAGDDVVEQLEKAGGKELGNEGEELGFFDKIGQTVDVVGSMVGLGPEGPEGPDREHTVQAGDTAAGVARELGVRVEDLGGLGKDPDMIYPKQVLTAPPEKPEEKTLEEDWEELKKIWGLYRGGMIGHSDISDRIQNIMKPRD